MSGAGPSGADASQAGFRAAGASQAGPHDAGASQAGARGAAANQAGSYGAGAKLFGALPLLVLAGGLLARLAQARSYFLNPDEAMHELLAGQATLGLAYRAALTAAHPPLFLVLLHGWRLLVQSELALRLPDVLAGTAAAWLTYRWLALVADRGAAFAGLLLTCFAPPLIALSAELRQYALLWLLMAACLLSAERARRTGSLGWMALSSLCLAGALLTHYSALVFALAIGVYMLLRLRPYGERRRLVAAWACGQLAAAGLAGYFLVTHAMRLRQSGQTPEVAEPWLHGSLYHPGTGGVGRVGVQTMAFAGMQTVHVFSYLLAGDAVGALALAAFLAGLVWLLLRRAPLTDGGPPARQLALLLVLPFVACCGVALAGLYPYGGTRHSAVLAPFALAGAAIGFRAVWPRAARAKGVLGVACLAFCNVFPAASSMKPSDHRGARMRGAVELLRRAAPRGSLVFADYQSGLLLGRYVCGHGVVQVFPPMRPFVRRGCGAFTAVTTGSADWELASPQVPGRLQAVAHLYGLPVGTRVWYFHAGWIAATKPRSPADVRALGCVEPHFFGQNIFLCELTLGGRREAGAAGFALGEAHPRHLGLRPALVDAHEEEVGADRRGGRGAEGGPQAIVALHLAP